MGKVIGVCLAATILLFASPGEGLAQASGITASLRLRPPVTVPTVQVEMDRSGDTEHPVFVVDAGPSWRVFLQVGGQRLDFDGALPGTERKELRTAMALDPEMGGEVAVRVVMAGAAL